MPIREDGTSLAERLTPLVPQTLTNVTATFVDSLKISSTSEKVRRGRRVMIKRRNIYSEQLADLANLYFRMSGIPIRFWSKAEDWRHWEVKSFRMLNGDRFRAFASGAKTVCTDKLPGKNLWEHLTEGTSIVERRISRPVVTWRFNGDKCHLQPKDRTSAADRLRTRPRQIAPGEIAARGRFARLSAGHPGNSLQPAMAAFYALLSQRLRRSNCTFRINKSPRAPERDCMDLVGRPNKFHESREGKAAARKNQRRDRQPGTLPGACRQTHAPETASFNQLPGN